MDKLYKAFCMTTEPSRSRLIRKYGPYGLYAVWPDPDATTRQDVVNFWMEHKAMPPHETDGGESRSRQVVLIARESHTQEIAGVSTAVAQLVQPLGFPCFCYRTFVAPGHRASWVLSKEIFVSSYEILNDRFRQGFDNEVLGLFIEVQNEQLHRHLNYAVWALDGMNVVYIGKNARGWHRRVWYFDGARVP